MAPAFVSFSVSYSGYALGLGLPPSVDSSMPLSESPDSVDPPPSEPVPTISIALVLILLGILAFLVSNSRVRSVITAACSTVAAALVIATQIVLFKEGAEYLLEENVPESYASDVFKNGSGFWLSTTILILTALYHVGQLVRGRSRPPVQHQAPTTTSPDDT